MTKIYISGPMTGYNGDNAEAFRNAAEYLYAIGYEPINPHDLMPLGESGTWADYLRADIKALMDCQGVATLTGWQESRGAALEVHIAQWLDMPVRPLARWWAK